MAVIVWPQRVLQQAGWEETAITRKSRYVNSLFAEASVNKGEYAALSGISLRATSTQSSVRGLDQQTVDSKEGARESGGRTQPTQEGSRTGRSNTQEGERTDRYEPTSERTDPGEKVIALPF